VRERVVFARERLVLAGLERGERVVLAVARGVLLDHECRGLSQPRLPRVKLAVARARGLRDGVVVVCPSPPSDPSETRHTPPPERTGGRARSAGRARPSTVGRGSEDDEHARRRTTEEDKNEQIEQNKTGGRCKTCRTADEAARASSFFSANAADRGRRDRGARAPHLPERAALGASPVALGALRLELLGGLWGKAMAHFLTGCPM